jgi:hypothetical protein
MKREVDRAICEYDTACRGCGAPLVRAYAADGDLLLVDAEMREEGRIVLMHRRAGEPPWIWDLDDEELQKIRAQHESRVRHGIESEPFRLFVLHKCKSARAVPPKAGEAS